eukprot:3932246-Rhodomonas_salina.1
MGASVGELGDPICGDLDTGICGDLRAGDEVLKEGEDGEGTADGADRGGVRWWMGERDRCMSDIIPWIEGRGSPSGEPGMRYMCGNGRGSETVLLAESTVYRRRTEDDDDGANAGCGNLWNAALWPYAYIVSRLSKFHSISSADICEAMRSVSWIRSLNSVSPPSPGFARPPPRSNGSRTCRILPSVDVDEKEDSDVLTRFFALPPLPNSAERSSFAPGLRAPSAVIGREPAGEAVSAWEAYDAAVPGREGEAARAREGEAARARV